MDKEDIKDFIAGFIGFGSLLVIILVMTIMH